jgi:hypothetical protein
VGTAAEADLRTEGGALAGEEDDGAGASEAALRSEAGEDDGAGASRAAREEDEDGAAAEELVRAGAHMEE